MSFGNSAGVYPRIVDNTFSVGGGGLLAGGIVITSKRGPTDITTVTSPREFMELYGMPTRDNPSLHAAIRFLRRAGILSVCRVIKDAEVATGELLDTADEAVFTFTAENAGKWGNDIEVNFSEDVGGSEDFFNLLVNYDGTLVESFKVSRDPDMRDGYGNNLYVETVVNKRSKYIRVVDSPLGVSTIGEIVGATVTFTGGADDTETPETAEFISAWDEFTNTKAVPAQLLINAGFAIPAIQAKMVDVAAIRGDAFALLDVPKSTCESVTDMVEYRNETLMLDSELASLHGGWLRIHDEYLDQEIMIPPSGDIAGIIVHTTEVAERWEAPAGLTHGIVPNVIGTSKAFSEGDLDQLYIAGINPITAMGGASAVVWGQKTLQKAESAQNRMNVVLSVTWMRNNMAEALLPYVFRPNTAFVRNSVDYSLRSFLKTIEIRGGLYGFEVDVETQNTPEVIDSGEMIVDVYVKPTRIAEYIRLNVNITPTGVTIN